MGAMGVSYRIDETAVGASHCGEVSETGSGDGERRCKALYARAEVELDEDLEEGVNRESADEARAVVVLTDKAVVVDSDAAVAVDDNVARGRRKAMI